MRFDLHTALLNACVYSTHPSPNARQRIQTTVSSLTAITSFLVAPYAGALMDAYGRKQVLVAAPLVSGLARVW